MNVQTVTGQAQAGNTHLHLRIALVSVTAACYVAAFFPLYDVLGTGVVSLSPVPAALAGWLLGVRVGTLAGAAAFPLNAALSALSGSGDLPSVIWGAAGSGVGALLVGALAGALRDVTDRLDREIQARSQAQEAVARPAAFPANAAPAVQSAVSAGHSAAAAVQLAAPAVPSATPAPASGAALNTTAGVETQPDNQTVTAADIAAVDLGEVADTVPAALMMVDRDGQVLYSNRAIAGLEASALRGINALRLVPRQDHPLFTGALDRVFRTGQPTGYQVADTAPVTGPTLHVLRFGPVIRDGQVTAVTLLTVDVSDGADAADDA
ncbi:MAG: PAS domain-containing protein [Dehalococcoidia bacterium]